MDGDAGDAGDDGMDDGGRSGDDTPAEAPAARRSVRKIVVRVVLVVAALGISTAVLLAAFDDLEPGAILDALRSLEDADFVAMLSMWILWIGAQGLQTASLIRDLPVRRGVVAFLGPAAVAFVVPGPSDLPVRHRMLTSWGRDPSEAALAVAAGGIFSIGIKLVLPVIAAVGLVVSGAPIEGTLRTLVLISLIVGAGLVAFAVALGSERRTQRMGELLDPVWSAVLRLMRRPEPEDLAPVLLEARARAMTTLRDRWHIAAWGTFLTAASRFALLLMALRFTGVSEAAVSWPKVFVVYALVQGLTVLPITAGDAGVSEVAYIALLTAAAGSELVNEVTAAVLLFRVLTWLVIIPIGLATLGLWRRSVARAGTSRPPSASDRARSPG